MGHKYLLGHIIVNWAVQLCFRLAGHSWSHLVTLGHIWSYFEPLPSIRTCFQRLEWLIWPSYELCHSAEKKATCRPATAGKNPRTTKAAKGKERERGHIFLGRHPRRDGRNRRRACLPSHSLCSSTRSTTQLSILQLSWWWVAFSCFDFDCCQNSDWKQQKSS